MDQDSTGAKGSGQSAQEDLNKLMGSAKEAAAGFQLGKLFEGRIGNMQFLYYLVGAIIVSLVAGMIPLVNLVVAIALAVVGVGVGIRRWHDVGVTGWATLIFFVPFVGLLAALYLCWKHGEEKENQYGPVPDVHRPFFHAVLNS
jgi:uncharacterized membrane protein YhaH (DUF805 family)